MHRTFNSPNWCYIIETTNREGQHLCFWRIEQYIEKVGAQTSRDRNASAVNKALHLYHCSTGCNYGIVWEGPPQTAEGMLKTLISQEA